MNYDFDRLFFNLTSILSYIKYTENYIFSFNFNSDEDDCLSVPSAKLTERWLDNFS